MRRGPVFRVDPKALNHPIAIYPGVRGGLAGRPPRPGWRRGDFLNYEISGHTLRFYRINNIRFVSVKGPETRR